MAMKIDSGLSLPPIAAPSLSTPASSLSSGSPGGGFGAALSTAVSQVEAARGSATAAATDLLANGKGDVHTVALAAQRADLSLEMFQQVRNKFVQAYQEIMKMPM
jgi:flagellar hook-basal body complex protein FliE